MKPIACVLTIWLMPLTTGAAEQIHNDPGSRILEALGVNPVDCGENYTQRYRDHVATLCGTTDQPFKTIKSRWKAAPSRKGSLSGSLVGTERAGRKQGTTNDRRKRSSELDVPNQT